MVKTDLDGRVRWTANGWYLFAERTPQFDPGRDGPAFERVLSRLAATKGIARVIRPQDFRALGIPDYDDNPYARGHVIVAADADLHLVIDPTSSSSYRRRKARAYHGHRYLPDHLCSRRDLRWRAACSVARINRGTPGRTRIAA
jgi:hypothetical protein